MSTMGERRRDLVEAFEAGLDQFTAVATAPDVELPGLAPRPEPTELAEIEARNQVRLASARRGLYDAALTRKQVMARLGVGSNQVSNLLRRRKLVALDGPDGQRFPVWQFDNDAVSIRLGGIEQVVAALPLGVVGLSQWMTTANPALDGRTPAETLVTGDVEYVVAAAEAVGS